MRHRLARIGWTVVLVLAAAGAASAAITHTPSQPNVDQTVTFTLVVSMPILPLSVEWDFGDGTTASGQVSVHKVYTAPGTYLVRVNYQDAAILMPYTETTSITIYERRSITYSPSAPLINQVVMFQAHNFLSASIRWDFGDGTGAVMGGAAMSHTYTYPSAFQVRAWDLGGLSTVPITAGVTVGADFSRRLIQAFPARPSAGYPVTLTAVNFLTSNIRWDFGDGRTVTGGPSVAHTYERSGTYLVQAWDWGGAYGPPVTLSLFVQEGVGPRSAFRIFFIQLRFADGKAYKMVPRGAEGLTAFADIKYEGTGVFRARWLVDGAPFRIVTRAMPFAEDMTLDSAGSLPGQSPDESRLPGLPTSLPGTHDVSLEILEPAADFVIPVIRYFVTADQAEEAPELGAARLEVDIERAAQGVGCRLEPDVLPTPAGPYILLNGTLSHGARRTPVRFALLRVHLDAELVDQRFLRDLKPGENRSFGTSIPGAAAANKWVYITVYDIDKDKAELLYFLKMKARVPER